MAANPTPGLVTVEEFRPVPEDSGPVYYELRHGEVVAVDLNQRQVKVSTPDGHTVRYGSGQEIPLLFGGGKTLAVDAIFE